MRRIRQRTRRFQGWLNRITEVPTILTEEQFARMRHTDLPELTPDELRAERLRVELRLALDPQPNPWLRERLRVVEDALA